MSQFGFTNIVVVDKPRPEGRKRALAYLSSFLKSDSVLTDISDIFFKDRDISNSDRVLITNVSSKSIEVVDSKGRTSAVIEPSGSFIVAGRDRIEDLGLLCHHTLAVSAA